MEEKNLYETIREKICEQIFQGTYTDGDRLPSERELAETYQVSRVTIRKTMELLEQEHLVIREVGRGTRITLFNQGNPDSMDMLVLIAPAKNPFFSQFIAAFQACAEEKHSLVLYVEKPGRESLENCLYRLYKRGLRNVVIWLEDLRVNPDRLRRLRAIGMNMVFFDSNQGYPYGDCVSLDNQKALETMYGALQARQCKRIRYMGWDLSEIYSIDRRQSAYIHIRKKEDSLITLSWNHRRELPQMIEQQLLQAISDGVDGILCGEQEIGEAAARAILQKDLPLKLATVDAISSEDVLPVNYYKQNLKKMAEEIYLCLNNQCTNRAWRADVYEIEGIAGSS